MNIDQYLYYVWDKVSLQSLGIWSGIAFLTIYISYRLRKKGYLVDGTAMVLPILAFYLAFVITITLTERTTRSAAEYHLRLFWSYRSIYEGSYVLAAQIFWNIVLFVPIGIMFSLIWRRWSLWQYAFCGLLLSAGIEILQLLTHRGLFEFDDMFHNTIGMVLGCLVIFPFEKRKRKWVIFSVLLFLWSGILVAWTTTIVSNNDNIIYRDISDYLRTEDTENEQDLQYYIAKDDSSQYFCFQIDHVLEENDTVILDGFAFPYNTELNDSDLHIMLLSDAADSVVEANVQAGLKREDIEQYFLCDEDYTYVGFRASVPTEKLAEKDEYAIYMSWPQTKLIFTGVYLTGTDVHYIPLSTFLKPVVEGTDLEPIVRDGILHVYCPDYSCYVYQYEEYLYWIVDKNFNFEEDGGTYLQYQLFTTQIRNLPRKRLRHNWYWDNLSGLFEDYEITDEIDCGRYRVCKRALPKDYSITSILTGYYADDMWIWKNYFRPYYEFG